MADADLEVVETGRHQFTHEIPRESKGKAVSEALSEKTGKDQGGKQWRPISQVTLSRPVSSTPGVQRTYEMNPCLAPVSSAPDAVTRVTDGTRSVRGSPGVLPISPASLDGGRSSGERREGDTGLDQVRTVGSSLVDTDMGCLEISGGSPTLHICAQSLDDMHIVVNHRVVDVISDRGDKRGCQDTRMLGGHRCRHVMTLIGWMRHRWHLIRSRFILIPRLQWLSRSLLGLDRMMG